MNNVGIFNDNVVMNNLLSGKPRDEQYFMWIIPGWEAILMNNAGNITSPTFLKCRLECINNN